MRDRAWLCTLRSAQKSHRRRWTCRHVLQPIRKLVEFVKQAESDSNVARLFKMLGFVDNMAKLGVPVGSTL